MVRFEIIQVAFVADESYITKYSTLYGCKHLLIRFLPLYPREEFHPYGLSVHRPIITS
jgi:hypothetical protein